LVFHAVGTLKIQERAWVSAKHHRDVFPIAGNAATDPGSKHISKCRPRRRERQAAIEQAVVTEDAPGIGGLTRDKRVLQLGGYDGQSLERENDGGICGIRLAVHRVTCGGTDGFEALEAQP